MADETETLEIDNAELSTTEDTIKSNTQTAVAETLDLDKQKILEKIRKAQNAEKRVKLFAKLTDKY
jgi:chromosome condensin MukBEF MukE localization factor